MLVRWAPDCQLELLPELMAAGMRGIYHGHAGVRELAADWTDTWERMDLIPEEIVDARNPVIGLGHLRLRGRGAASSSTRQSPSSGHSSEAWSCASATSPTGTR